MTNYEAKIVGEMITDVLSGIEMEEFRVNVIPVLLLSLTQVNVCLGQKYSISFLRAAAKEIRNLFMSSDRLFIKFELNNSYVYKITIDPSAPELEEVAEEWKGVK